MRSRWACPDLGLVKEPGYYQPIPGSQEEFPDCPAYYLRTAGEQAAAHLIDGAIHPASIVSQRAFELEAGAISADKMSPKALELTHLWLREKAARRDWEREQQKGRSK